MKKKVTKKPVIKKVKNSVTPGLGGAPGVASFNSTGFPFNQGVPWSAPVENAGTMFRNLRYYFVSNFRQLLSQAYCEIGLIQTITDVPVDDGFRGGIEIKSKQLSETEIKKVKNSLDRDNDLNNVAQAVKWNRLFGGAGVLIMTDQDPEMPLNIEAINKDTPLEFRAVDLWELYWSNQNVDGFDPQIQTTESDYFDYYDLRVHKSRVMVLKGIEAPSFLRPRLRGWGLSIAEALVRSINQYLKATDLGFEVLDEFKLDIYKIKNLVNTLMSPGGQQKVQERVQMANWQKNYQSAVVMDSEDDFDHKQLSFSGLAEAMTGIRMQVAADMRMPITKLFGTSASSGFSTDQNDMENYNSMVESQVRNKSKYHILKVIEIKCQHMFGYIPDDLEIEFKPLRELTAVDAETVKTQKFTRISQARAAGEITSFEYREACNRDDLLSIQLDMNSLDEIGPVADEENDEPGADKQDVRTTKLKEAKDE